MQSQLHKTFLKGHCLQRPKRLQDSGQDSAKGQLLQRYRPAFKVRRQAPRLHGWGITTGDQQAEIEDIFGWFHGNIFVKDAYSNIYKYPI